jgi:MoaA/NifB/PqqE/SkfB family radical SAM enzyme
MTNNKVPNDLVLAITYNCNSRCRMCNIWKMEQMLVLDLAEYEKLPATLHEVNITGGEPFLSSNLIAIIKILVAKNPQVRIIISTNGFATELIKSKIKEILTIKPDIGVGISLDGMGQVHDQIRGIPGGFQKVMNTIAVLKELGIKNLRLAFTAGDYNINELHRVYKLSKELGIEFTLAAVHNADNYFNTVDNKISKVEDFRSEFGQLIKEELKSWKIKRWLRAYFAFALYKFIETGQRLLPNYSGQDNFFIDPLGNVYPADVSGHLLGNLKDFNSLAELFNSARAQEAIKLEKINQNWMICTARSAMKRHPWQILTWLLKNKTLGVKL